MQIGGASCVASYVTGIGKRGRRKVRETWDVAWVCMGVACLKIWVVVVLLSLLLLLLWLLLPLSSNERNQYSIDETDIK